MDAAWEQTIAEAGGIIKVQNACYVMPHAKDFDYILLTPGYCNKVCGTQEIGISPVLAINFDDSVDIEVGWDDFGGFGPLFYCKCWTSRHSRADLRLELGVCDVPCFDGSSCGGILDDGTRLWTQYHWDSTLEMVLTKPFFTEAVLILPTQTRTVKQAETSSVPVIPDTPIPTAEPNTPTPGSPEIPPAPTTPNQITSEQEAPPDLVDASTSVLRTIKPISVGPGDSTASATATLTVGSGAGNNHPVLPPQPPSSNSPPSSPLSTLSSGAVAAISVCIVALVFGLLGLAHYRRRKTRSMEEQQTSPLQRRFDEDEKLGVDPLRSRMEVYLENGNNSLDQNRGLSSSRGRMNSTPAVPALLSTSTLVKTSVALSPPNAVNTGMGFPIVAQRVPESSMVRDNASRTSSHRSVLELSK